ncbi:hypothetical protein PSTT_12837, partial [Puccinia striiformis]
SINTTNSSQDTETLLEEGDSSSSSKSESLPCGGFSSLPSPEPTMVVPSKCIVGYLLQLEDRKQGQKTTWTLETSQIPCSYNQDASIPNNKGDIQNLACCTLNAKPINIPRGGEGIFLSQLNPKQKKSQPHNKNLIAKPNIRLEAPAAKSVSSHQAINNHNSKEDDSDNEGSIIEDIDLYTDQIPKRYGVDCCYNSIFLSFLHPTKITKYIPLLAEKIHVAILDPSLNHLLLPAINACCQLENKSGVSINLPPSKFQD